MVRRLKFLRRLDPRRIRCALAIGAGLLFTASLPKGSVAGLAWIAPGLMLGAALGVDGRHAFRLGWLAGFAHQLATLYWLLRIPFPAGAIPGWLALSAYLALFPACWVGFTWSVFPGARPASPSANGPLPCRELAAAYAATSLFHRQLWLLASAAGWVALEMAQGRILTGFPWNFLGVSQYRMPPLIQIASITGVYGVSFLVVWSALALMSAALLLIARPAQPGAWRVELLGPIVVVTLVVGAGVRRIQSHPPPARSVTLALIQPSIPQTLIWNPREDTNRFAQLLRLSERALTSAPKPDVLVWPEAAVPNLFRYDPQTYEAITNLVRTHKIWAILGADDAQPRLGATTGREFDLFNSSFLISPDGELVASYRKRRLVAFGEFVPLGDRLPWLKRLLPAGEGFRAGDRAVPFAIPALGLTTSVLICFEDTFAHLARRDVQPDTDFLLNLTNNGWFGESAAQWQHAATSAFRAVENGLPLVRCANNGLTCWVDELGVLHEEFFPGTTDIYGAGFKIVRVPLLATGATRELTFYTRHGDVFGWGCVAVTVGLMARPWLRRRAGRPVSGRIPG